MESWMYWVLFMIWLAWVTLELFIIAGNQEKITRNQGQILAALQRLEGEE